jgi:hypothetical protein
MFRKSISARVALVLLAVAAGACSSRSGGTASQPPGWPSTYLFYTDGGGGLVAVDPASLATIVVEPAGSAVSVPTLVPVGTWNPTSSLLENVHTHAIVYRKRDAATGDDQLWTASAAQGAAPVSRRLTGLSVPASDYCSPPAVFPDHATPEASAVVLELGGFDADCATTADNWLALIRLSSEPSGYLKLYGPNHGSVVAAVPSATGGIQGWLLRRGSGGGLWYEASDWATAVSTPLTTSEAVEVVAVHPGNVWLSVDGNLKVLAAGASALADPGNVATTVPAARATATDGRNLYLVPTGTVGATIQRVPLDGSGAVVPVHALGSDAALALAVSDDRVAYRAQSGEWKAFPKAGGSAVTLFTPAASGDAVAVHVSGRSFYFHDRTTPLSASVDPNGATTSHGEASGGSGWAPLAGSTVRFGTAPWQNPDRMIRVDVNTAAAVTTLRVFDGATATQLGGAVTFPPEYATSTSPAPFVYAEGSGSSHVALVGAYTGGSGWDVLAVDAGDPTRLRKVSAMSSAETPVGTGFSCSTGGGLAALPALVSVVALRLLRRRRRD